MPEVRDTSDAAMGSSPHTSDELLDAWYKSVSEEGFIMSLRHREYDIRGIQYHPESVLTPGGKTIIKNWLETP